MIIREAKISDTHYIYMLNKDGLGYDYSEEKTKIKIQKILSMKTDMSNEVRKEKIVNIICDRMDKSKINKHFYDTY